MLIATDVVARGMDFKGVNCVINYDFPESGAAYIHRIGMVLTNLSLISCALDSIFQRLDSWMLYLFRSLLSRIPVQIDLKEEGDCSDNIIELLDYLSLFISLRFSPFPLFS